MKTILVAGVFTAAVFLTACQSPGVRGTAGVTGYQAGTDREEGSTPFAVGRSSEFQRAGLANVNMAVSRAEASMDVSPSGSGELSRRSAAATIRGTSRQPRSERPLLDDLELVPTGVAADQIVRDRVQQALGSPAPNQSDAQPLSIQTLNNLRIEVRNGQVTLRGRVPTRTQGQEIETLVRGVQGVREVVNELQVSATPAALP